MIIISITSDQAHVVEKCTHKNQIQIFGLGRELEDLQVLEVKCPFTYRDKRFLAESRFFLQEHNGKLALKQDQAYFFQILMQMKVCGTLKGQQTLYIYMELLGKWYFKNVPYARI